MGVAIVKQKGRSSFISRFAILAILFGFTSLVPATPAAARIRGNESLVIMVSASEQAPFRSILEIKDPVFVRQLLSGITRQTSQQPDLPRATLLIGKRRFVYDSYAQLYEVNRQANISLAPDVHSQLEKWISRLENVHYGKPLEWEHVKREFRRMGYATVTDLETGKSFRVQRRAGSRHADVQPLTSEDTAIMKEIYSGKWSWKRRAILLSLQDQTFAASMHGMPHGAGAIAGNQFSGHFCIHFRGSSTHKRKQSDPSHNMMILKASGQLNRHLLEADPRTVVETFLLSLQEQDERTMRLTTNGFELPFPVEDVLRIRHDMQKNTDGQADLLTVDLAVPLVYIMRGKKEQKDVWHFHLERPSPFHRWKIAEIETGDLLNGEDDSK